MRSRTGIHTIAALTVVLASTGLASAQKPQTPVTGQGVAGKITKWTSATSVTDSNITEDKHGRVGIGVTVPNVRLAVAGVIESVAGGDFGGGFKFPDGSIQKSAGLLANQVVGSENIIVTPSGNTVVISAKGLLKVGEAVTSLNGAAGDLNIQGSGIVSVTRSGNTIEISADPASALVFDNTLKGDGSAQAPLGVRLPLVLIGESPSQAVIFARNTGGASSAGADLSGSDTLTGEGGTGIIAMGGGSSDGSGGVGVSTSGGAGTGIGQSGGVGIIARGGTGNDGAISGNAGTFVGNVLVIGDVNATGAVSRKIDHPLDPENKLLVHAAVESSEVMNVYSGNVTTDASGTAVVTMPDWFESVNADLRYQLTVVGSFARAMVAEKVKDNRFTIKTDEPNVEVSWLVTGVRADEASKKAAFTAVQDKPERERGTIDAQRVRLMRGEN